MSSSGLHIQYEFIKPSIITDPSGNPIGLVKDNDAIIFFNFRIDRPRQLTATFIIKDFNEKSLSLEFDPYLEKYAKTNIPEKPVYYQKLFKRDLFLNNLYFTTMTKYSKSLVEAGAKVAYPPEVINFPLGKAISAKGFKQLRVSESEKERFVTFYFNGQNEAPYKGEERLIVTSPNVPTYDLKPEMFARELTERTLNAIKQNEYKFILINFCNPDMVGHTGNIGPAAKACEVVDECIGKITNFCLAYGGTLLITADHGNVEEMINLHTGQIDTEHSINYVPFIAVSKSFTGKNQVLPEGILADIAPTVLSLLDIEPPSSMTGRNLLESVV